MAESPPSPGFGRKTPGSLNNICRLVELLLKEQESGQDCSIIIIQREIRFDLAGRKQLPARGAGGTDVVIEPFSDKESGPRGGVIPVVNWLPASTTWRGEDLLDLEISADNLLVNGTGEEVCATWMRLIGINVKQELCMNVLTKILIAERCIPIFLNSESLDEYTLSELLSDGLTVDLIGQHDSFKAETSSLLQSKERSHAQNGAVKLQEISSWTDICSDVSY